MKVNFYQSVRDTTPSSCPDIYSIYEYIRDNPRLKQVTEMIQANHRDGILDGFQTVDKKSYQDDKTRNLPCVIFAGMYDRAINADEQSGVEHTGRMNIDIDLNSPAELDAFFNAISDGAIPFVEASARSVSGLFNGALWANVRIEIPTEFASVPMSLVTPLKLTESNFKSKLHTAFFDMFAVMLETDAGIKSGSTKDVKRMRYISHDSDIYVNTQAVPLSLAMLDVHLTAKQKHSKTRNDSMSAKFAGGVSDPYKIAYKFAQNKMGEPVAGNYHNFVMAFASCLNRMGIAESDCLSYVETQLGIAVNSNCVSYPYKAYSGDFGTWDDWRNNSPTPAPTQVEPPTQREQVSSNYFQPLGFNKDDTGVQRFYFYAFMSNTIITLTASKMSKANLYQLAPLEWWEIRFPKKTGFDLDSAVDYLITVSNKRGYFSPLRLRGRGAWMDHGRVVIHTGTELIIEGKRHRLGSIETEFIYELGENMNLTTENPLTAAESKEWADVIKLLDWTRGDLDSILLCGWLALAPICGALKWRPHLWLTGGSGSGKSWVNVNVINRFLGECAYKVEGGSTEAGIRELVGSDAMCIAFDEAEGENEKEQRNMENILHLMRSCSGSENMIVKGTGNGARMYLTRSMFVFTSIVPQTTHGADKRRTTVLRLGKGIPKNEFPEFEREYNRIVNPKFIQRFQSRMINLMPQIIESIEIFNSAITKHTGRKDMGDQLGAMFGGYWHIEFDAPVTKEIAEKLVKTFDLESEQSMESQTDEERCLQHIISAHLRVSDMNISIGELIEIVNSGLMSDMISGDVADATLKRHGIKWMGDKIAISNTSVWIKSILRNTAWAKDHRSVLGRLEGAEHSKQEYFIGGFKSPVVYIPIKKFIEI